MDAGDIHLSETKAKPQEDLESQKPAPAEDKKVLTPYLKSLRKSLSLTTRQIKDFSEIPLCLIDIQVELSQLKDKLNAISAGILTLGDVVNLNK